MDAAWFSDVRYWAGGAAACAAALVILSGLGVVSKFWVAVFWAGACIVLAGLGTLAYQSLLSLHDGYWTDWKFRAALTLIGLGSTSSSLGGAGWIIQQITGLPMAVGLMGAGFLVASVGTVGQVATKDREREARTDRSPKESISASHGNFSERSRRRRQSLGDGRSDET